MGLRRRHSMASVGLASQHMNRELGASSSPPSSTSLKFVLLACVLVLLLLVFAVSWKREGKGSCALCMRGDGVMRKWRDGDGVQVVELAFAEEGDGEVVGSVMSHQQICPQLYHEKQSSRLDLMHAFNNLLQGNGKFTREEMDDLAGKVQEMGSTFEKHFDPYTGNYDAEVLKAAAASRAKTLVFFDKAEAIETIDLSGSDGRLLGLILHLKRRLWIAIRLQKGLWYNFDSTKATPLVFCDGAPGLHLFLNKVLNEGGLVAAVLIPPPVAPNTSAKRPPPSLTSLEYWKTWLYWR